MSECVRDCRLCPKFVISTGVTFVDDELVINLPQRNYGNCVKYCIVVAQDIPAETTINAPVVFTIGTDETIVYPFLNRDCTPIRASQMRVGTVYSSRVFTGIEEGVFKYIGKCCLPSNATTTIASLPIPTAEVTQSDTGNDTSNNTNSKAKGGATV